VVHFAYLVRNTCIEKYALGSSRFAGINVRHDADVSIQRNGRVTSHKRDPGPASHPTRLPAVVRKRLICFSHTMHIVTLFDSRTALFSRIAQFTSQFQHHGFLTTLARSIYDPTHG